LSKGLIVKLRFEVDQAACLRAGIDCPKSIITVEINPAKLPQKERDVIADRLEGIDVRGVTDRPSSLEIKGEPVDVAEFMPLVLMERFGVASAANGSRSPARRTSF